MAHSAFFPTGIEPEETSTRHRLHSLTASDPAALANMTRHTLALQILATGSRDDGGDKHAPCFISSFEMTRGECNLIMAATHRLGVAQIVQCFDVDDAAGAPRGLGVFRAEGENIVVYPRCLPWAPADGGPRGHRAARSRRSGLPLRRTRGASPGPRRRMAGEGPGGRRPPGGDATGAPDPLPGAARRAPRRLRAHRAAEGRQARRQHPADPRLSWFANPSVVASPSGAVIL